MVGTCDAVVCWVLALLLLLRSAECLSVKIDAPAFVLRGDTLWLNCSINSGDSIHRVNWYKDNKIFYTYVATDGSSPLRTSGVAGVVVSHADSSEGNVLLMHADINTEGMYRCDVTLQERDVPHKGTHKVKVLVVERQGPIIEGLRAQYQIGEEISLKCISGPSRPEPNLEWLINGKKPEKTIQSITIDKVDNLLSNVIKNMRINATEDLFINGTMRVGCIMEFPYSQVWTTEKFSIVSVASASPRPQSSAQRVSLDVPSIVIHGNPFWLNCSFNNDYIHSVIWSKNNEEFYRYTPSDDPPGYVHNIPGVYVKDTPSKMGTVYLYKSDLDSEGSYACKVIFNQVKSKTVQKTVRIYVTPDEQPTIENLKTRYIEGEDVNVTCKSGPTKPTAFMKWYINDAPVSTELIQESTALPTGKGTFLSMTTLSFKVGAQHSCNGTLRLRCTVELGEVHSSKTEVQVEAYTLKEWEQIQKSTGNILQKLGSFQFITLLTAVGVFMLGKL